MSFVEESWQFAAFQTAPASPKMEKDFLTLAASVAVRSSYPGHEAIVHVATTNGCPSSCPVVGFQDFPGRGFGGAVTLPGEETPRAGLFGSRDFMTQCGLEVPAILEVAARRWEEEGAHVVMGGWDGYVRGLMKFVKIQQSAVSGRPTS